MASKKILLAEDDLDDQRLFNDFLHQRSDIVLMPMAENGVAVMNILEGITTDADLPHFIILDQNMPKQNGLQTLQLLKQSNRYAHIPVMVYSTYADEHLIKKSSLLGACLVMPKPITKAGYDEMIDACLKNLV